MKIKFYSAMIIAAFMMLFTSCKKDGFNRNNNEQPASNSSLDVTIKTGAVYTLNLNSYGNGNASITKQAVNYSISQISRDGTGNNMYQFSPGSNSKTDGASKEQVILKVTGQYKNEQGGGCHHSNNSNNSSYTSYEKNITLNFTVN